MTPLTLITWVFAFALIALVLVLVVSLAHALNKENNE